MLLINKIKKRIIPQSKYPDFLRKRGVIIGENCEIYKSVNFGSEPYLITIGNHVRINGGVQLVTHDGGCWVLRDKNAGYEEEFQNADRFGKITIHDNVHIGTNAIIMPGVDIGENCIIACGAVVTHNVPANMVFGGGTGQMYRDIGRVCFQNTKKICKDKTYEHENKEKISFERNFLEKNKYTCHSIACILEAME